MIDLNLVLENSDIARINKSIAHEHRTIDNRPKFRIVWSDKIYENRYGTFNDFTESGLFIRTVTEVRRVRKYAYIFERWIMEMWAGAELMSNKETPDVINGDYVCIYVFEDSKGNPLPVTEKVIKFLINFFFGKIEQDYVPSQEYLDAKDIERQVDSMDTHPIFQTRSGDARNAVAYDRNLKGKKYE